MDHLNRRRFMQLVGLGALGAAGTTALTACGGGSGGNSIRYAWWGDTVRQQKYTAALEAFAQQNPGVEVRPEFADYDAFQERITVQTAGRDVPDVFWIPSPHVMSYHDAGLYRRLDDIPSLDLSAFSAAQLDSFKIDGELNTLPRSVLTAAVRFNQTFLDEAGAQLPADDAQNWTWDRLSEFLIDYSRDAPPGRKGIHYNAQTDLCFEAWLRQHGQDLWTADGRMGFDAAALAGWFEWWEVLRRAGAATNLSEQEGAQPEWPVVGDKVLVTFGNSNHIADEAPMFPDYEFGLRPMPVLPDAAAGHRFGYLSRIAVYQGIDDESVDLAGRLVQFNINDPQMLQLVGLSVGAPANPAMLRAAYDVANEDEKKMLAVVERELAEEQKPRYEAPAGSGTWRSIMTRGVEEVALERASVSDAAARVIADIDRELGQAS
ncbi:ABC transporter substrate-binding protein [Pseudonocardia sp. CNS-004]|nr:ABC transporter substrate-binding protein [Pseudonocardia sp. CNS-004]